MALIKSNSEGAFGDVVVCKRVTNKCPLINWYRWLNSDFNIKSCLVMLVLYCSHSLSYKIHRSRDWGAHLHGRKAARLHYVWTWSPAQKRREGRRGGGRTDHFRLQILSLWPWRQHRGQHLWGLNAHHDSPKGRHGFDFPPANTLTDL